MTFLASWRLLLLVAPLVLLVVYLWVQHSRRRIAVRFTSVDLLASVVPRRSGWQRHLASAALLMSLILLVLAFAQPARVERTPKQQATVMLTLDISGSMIANDVSPSRLAAAQQAARDFVQALPPGVQLGVVSFSTTASVLVSPTSDRSSVLAAINSLQPGGGTATGGALKLALDSITAQPKGAGGKAVPSAIVLMSDGSPTLGLNGESPLQSALDIATQSKQDGVKIDTIAFGTADGTVTVEGQVLAVPWDPAAMAQIASLSGGQTFKASSSQELRSVYTQIGRVVGYDVHRHEVTAWFTGAGLLLAALAGVASLLWTQRIA
ncbi:MAG TPA: VWA domain-containing protein [Acidimicrobiales bacterium]|jgi:Ca-activated chloride channel family protein|nr:VWA domain-containing protein [Acidimicrobiales bacterium]